LGYAATPDIDKEMFDYVYSIVCPDQMKVYPHEIVPWTITKKWYDQGKYTPYFDNNPKDLIDVVRYSMEKCPSWCRLPRVVRDIPINYIHCGNTNANLRQMIDDQLDKEGIISMDIRSREIGRHSEYYTKPAFYNTNYYYSNNGHNYHIEYVSLDKRALFGFIRLRIVDKNNLTCLDILKNKGLIRELHVYGDTTAVSQEGNVCQHRGIGKGLLERAEIQTMKAGLYGIVVISGEGVKGYYELSKNVILKIEKNYLFLNIIKMDNDSVEDLFLYEIDLAIENHSPEKIYKLIKEYEKKISKGFIDIAYRVYREMVTDKLLDMEL
jgi:histone acetyltransferase (RNA polymerase elongator complex component)